MKNIFVLFFTLLICSPAYAYLDPATGNALVYLVLSLIGAFLFAIKKIFYWFIGKKSKQEKFQNKGNNLILFSEGKNYWNSFKPIIDNLIKKNFPFTYYTMDEFDPALDIESDLMTSYYIGNGVLAMHKMSNIHADIMLTTTPNIGCPEYPMKKSPFVNKMIYFWHSFGPEDGVWVRKGSNDFYDELITTNETTEERVRLLEKKRNLKNKKITVLGCTYLDILSKQVDNMDKTTDGKTILIAPSWGSKNCLNLYGTKFIFDLANAGYNIILRPHPHSFKAEADKINKIIEEISVLKNITIDREINSNFAMAKSDMMISDTSGVRFDYFVLYQRPIITLEMPVVDAYMYEYDDLHEILDTYDTENEIGKKVSKKEIENIVQIVSDTLKEINAKDFDFVKNKYVKNIGCAGEKIADYLINELSDKKD